VNPAAITGACSAAITALEADVRRAATPPVIVTPDVVTAAMSNAVSIRKKRVGRRAKKV